jgi:hypothetical protein
VREETVDSAIAPLVAKLIFDAEELEYIRGWVEGARADEHTRCQQELQNARLQLDGIRIRLGRLTDALIDGMIEKPAFEARKTGLLSDEQRTLETIRNLEAGNGDALERLERFLELVRNAPVAYKNAEPDEKRDLVKNLLSNLRLIDKKIDAALKPSVLLIANRPKPQYGAPYRGVHRTWNRLLKKLITQFETEIVPGEAVA